MMRLVALDGAAFVWSADDWYELRKQHRICGNLIGTLGMLAHQDNTLGLPVALMPEETTLLLQQKIARLVNYASLTAKPSGDIRERFEEFRKQSFQEQVKFFQEERCRKITEMVDIIVEGKRRKLMGLTTKKAKRRKLEQSSSMDVSIVEGIELPDRDSIIKDEFKKVVPISEDISLVQVPTECPYLKDQEGTTVDFPIPTRGINYLKAKTFATLWGRGFYVTSGQKFGGDFLAYPGDPMKFHAQYIVLCKMPNDSIPALSLVSICRVASTVKKAVLLATFDVDGENDQGEVRFETISWLS